MRLQKRIQVQKYSQKITLLKILKIGGPVVMNLPTNAGDTGSIPGLGRLHVPRSN